MSVAELCTSPNKDNTINNTNNTITKSEEKIPNCVDIDFSSRQRSVYWTPLNSINKLDISLNMIDQRDLPHSYSIKSHNTLDDVINSIKIMLVRGAPAIGAAGAFGMVIAAINSKSNNINELLNDLMLSKKLLDDSRPTAVNLSWATNRIMELAKYLSNSNSNITLEQLKYKLLNEAQLLADEDILINKRIGDYGANIIPQSARILHHCNTGCLATVDYGTALGVIYSSYFQKKNIHVYVDETRPRLQGSKLTAWELMKQGVSMQLIVDSASGLLMYNNKIDIFLFGADRVAANGDVANKIGKLLS